MAIQSSFYSGTALDSRTFPSTKHIPTKQHMAVWLQQVLDDAWVQMPIGDYQLINNACVLNDLLDTALYKQLEVRVADTTGELITSPSDTAIVAGMSDEIAKIINIANDGGYANQFIGKGLLKGIQVMAQSSVINDKIIVPQGTNAFSVGDFTLADGASITVEDGSTYKIL